MTEQRYHNGNQRQLRRLLSLLPSSSKEHTSLIAKKVAVLLTDEDLIKETVITAGCGMRHSSWDVRFALSSCLEEASRRCLILPSSACVSGKIVSLKALETAWLNLTVIDIQAVLESGTPLFSRAPAGLLAEVIEANSMSVRLGKQKQQLMRCIGLETSETGEATYYGGVAAILTEEDINVIQPMLPEDEKGGKASSMSSRMRNRKRRRAAESSEYCKRGYICHVEAGLEGSSSAFNSALQDMDGLATVLEDKADNGGVLPCFESNATALEILLLVANDLAFTLFHQSWEARHGAALGLVSIVRGLGGWIPDPQWAEDLVSRCICVLALDRFGDYSLSSMVAPVRETVAQLLGLTAHALSSDAMSETAAKLASLTTCHQWEVRHGGFVGLQALAALEFGPLGATTKGGGLQPRNVTICRQPSRQVWQIGLEAALEGLTDAVDDVCGGAASLLRWILDWVPPPLGLGGDDDGTKESVRCEVSRKVSQAVWKALDGIQLNGYLASCTSDLLQLLEACGESAIPSEDHHNGNLKGLLTFWCHSSHSVRCSTGRLVSSNLMKLLNKDEQNSKIIAWRCIWGLQHDPCNEALEICEEIASRLGKSLSSTSLQSDNCGCCHATIDSILRLVFLPEGDVGTLPFFPFFNQNPEVASSYPSLSTWALPVTFHRRTGTRRVIVNLFCPDNVMKRVLDIISLSKNSIFDVKMACQMETAYLLLSECLSAGVEAMDTAEALVAKQLSGSAGNGLRYDEELRILRETFEMANQEALRELLVVGNADVKDVKHNNNGERSETSCDNKKNEEWGHRLTWEAKAEVVKIRISEIENLWWRRITCVAVKCALLALNGKRLSTLNILICPLMETLKMDPCYERKEFAAETLSYMVARLRKSAAQYPECSIPHHHVSVCHKLLNNLSCYICSSDVSQKWGGEAALVLIFGSCPVWGEEMAHNDPIQCWLRDRLKIVQEASSAYDNSIAATGTAIRYKDVAISLGVVKVMLGYGCKRFANKDKKLQLRFKRQQICIIDEMSLLQSLLRLSRCYYRSEHHDLATLALNAFLEACEAHPERAWAALQKEQPLFNTSDPLKARYDAVIFSNSLEAMTRRNDVAGTVVVESLPTILRGMTDSDGIVRQSLSAMFSKMVTLLSTVHVPTLDTNNANIEDEQPSSAQSFQLPSIPKMGGQLPTQCGILISKHLIRGDPLPVMGPVDLPDDLREAMRFGKDGGVVLRPYQWEGVAWLDFLRQIGAHGILADDMGLGKTLQSLLSIALAWCSNPSQNAAGTLYTPSLSPGCNTCSTAAPALVICPTTLVSHWVNEAMLRFGDWLSVVPVIGNHESRRHAISSIFSGNKMSAEDSKDDSHLIVVVVSYSTLKAEVNWLSKQWWGSLVFDEAHLLRNPGTKLHYAMRQLRSNHRIALTGTPIQNSALELWSIFEFTMPGYLGDISEFRSNFVTPIRAAFKSGSDTQCALDGIASLGILHKKVLPFVLRREKGSVLSELPPKVIVDVFCDLTPYQVMLHNALASTNAAKEITATLVASSESAGDNVIPKAMMRSGSSALRWLSAMQRLCVHPALAVPDNHPDKQRLLKDPQASSKLTCLRQLLWDCGLGLSDYIKTGSSSSSSVGCNDDEEVGIEKGDGGEVVQLSGNTSSLCGGKVLVFAQCKATLDVIEMCLLKPQLPSVQFVRLDGSMTPTQRDRAVKSFQEDPSVTLILITTRVGGLGLNLTAASAIIFLEHDWNPMADLQAMDRAHRLGQRHCLMVYRIIARKSIEERIMALQSLKVKTAETIINTDNSNLYAMNINEVINLLNVSSPGEDGGSKKNRDAVDSGVFDIFASPDWESSDYAYLDLENFVNMFVIASETGNNGKAMQH